ncbi:plasmid maintenance protein [Borrelia coriaceae]|uniref:plasmid maintenance protein n=1 Tax=Borrelia coriaceae TaxID=144 RepID=UPI000483C34F|nr:plasmid maintenance protein [Borrelia coriaceae]
MLLKNTDSSKPKKEECRFKRNDVETRLTCEHKISKNYLKQIKEHSNNDATYINALINLETAINEYQGEYYIEDILEHFLKQFGNRYKYKIWMMMRRSDGVISDYALIWEGKFRGIGIPISTRVIVPLKRLMERIYELELKNHLLLLRRKGLMSS